jgi:ABC-type antimicrobial peptide transport system permease subunit
VVGDVHQDLYERGATPQLYAPRPQLPRQMNMVTAQRTMLANAFVVRTAGDPTQMVAALRAALNEVDSTQVMTEVHTVDAYAARQLGRTRETSVVLSLFGAVSIVLAVVGLYAIVAHMVSQRTREIGIRLALGARRSAVLHLILRQGLRLVVVGMAIGLAASLLLTRAMQGLLWSVSPTDPLTFAVVMLALFGIGALACVLPARRASRIDPLLVIKD